MLVLMICTALCGTPHPRYVGVPIDAAECMAMARAPTMICVSVPPEPKRKKMEN